MYSKTCIIDSSVWLALLIEGDSQKEKGLLAIKGKKYSRTLIPECVYAEVLNVTRIKGGKGSKMTFLQCLDHFHIKITLTNQKIFNLANRLFQTFAKLSFADATILAFALDKNLELITFDNYLFKAWNKVKK